MATRLYFSLTEPAPITNVSFDAGWSTTTGATRFFLSDSKSRTGSAITIGNTISWANTAQTKALDRQFVSRELRAQTISGSVSGQLMVREYAGTDNVSVIITKMSIVSGDGTVVRGVLLPLGSYSTTAEFVNNATHRNKTIANADSLSSVTVQNGDRIVVEIGYSNTSAGTSPQASAKWGDTGGTSDLPTNETQTSNGCGWIEFTADILFKRPNVEYTTMGIGAN